ncbi:MAG: hypothetical protein QXP53_02145 [Candidatus Pacearchaeota archaeon]
MANVKEVYQILTRSSIRKSWPPNPHGVKECIKYFLDNDQPLILVTNWLGVKTTKEGVADKVDEAALLFLKKRIVDELKKINVRVIIKILFTDINASYLEGYPREKIDLYYNTLKPIFDSLGEDFKLIRVNQEIWGNLFKLDPKENLTLDEIAKKTKDVDILNEVKTRAEKIIKSPFFERFKSQAEKHSLFVKKNIMTSEEVAKRYIYFRIFARRRYKKLFPHELYFSYAEPDLNELIISMPSIYIFSFHRGFSDCPWFIDENNERFKILVKNLKNI